MSVRKLMVVSTIAVGLALTGCSNKGTGYKSKAGGSQSDVSTQGMDGQDRFADPSTLNDVASLSAHNTFYFDFDKYNIHDEDYKYLDAHARYLKNHNRAKVRVEGHTDERGSREYNVGLGERRAKSVQRYLISQGVASDQIATVSYGEEKPAVNGHDEETAYRWNRRAIVEYEASGE